VDGTWINGYQVIGDVG